MKKHLFLILFAIVASVSTTSAAITVRLDPQSCSSWSTVRLWAWTSAGNVFNAWPGEIVSTDTDGWYAYTFDESITEVSIIWNNGTAQTVDITGITASTCYALNSTSGTAITVRVVDCPTNVEPELSIPITVRLHAQSTRWNIYLWAWTSAGNVFDTWPGEPVSIDEDGWYSYTFADSITEVNIIWNDNGESQTGEITGITESTCFAFNTNGFCHIVDCPGDAKHVWINDFFYNLHGTDRIAELTYQNRQRDKNYPWTSSADIPASVTYNGINYRVTSIGDSAFCFCTSLTSIDIPNSITSIGEHAFYGCTGLTSMTIPNSVTSIGRRAFNDCSGLTSITVSPNNPIYDSRNNCNAIIETSTNTLIAGCQNTIILNRVTSIGSFAFQYCSSLTSVTCMATTPPSISSNVFLSVDCSTIPLYVPAQSVGLYKEADHWKNFRVLPIDFSGYTITFANWDGSILQLLYIEEGEIPEYTGVTPTRSDDDGFTYTFIGWSPTIVAATEDATYTATYEASPLQYYTIRFENWDNSELQSIQVAENKMPVYTGPTPTRPNDDEYTYSFIGWSPTIVAATEDATYTAKYEAKERAITVRLNPQSCSSWSTVRLWAWTDNGNIFDAWPGEIISKDGDGWYSYTFEKSITSVSVIWNNGTDQTVDINNVTESTCYSLNSQSGKSITVSAVSCPKKKYTITFVNWNGDELQKGQVQEGEMPQYAGLTPTRPDDENYTYEFSGWTPEIVPANEDATYTATYEESQKAQVGFESVVEENLAIRMIINNGQLFILRDGKTYTVQGQEVR